MTIIIDADLLSRGVPAHRGDPASQSRTWTANDVAVPVYWTGNLALEHLLPQRAYLDSIEAYLAGAL